MAMVKEPRRMPFSGRIRNSILPFLSPVTSACTPAPSGTTACTSSARCGLLAFCSMETSIPLSRANKPAMPAAPMTTTSTSTRRKLIRKNCLSVMLLLPHFVRRDIPHFVRYDMCSQPLTRDMPRSARRAPEFSSRRLWRHIARETHIACRQAHIAPAGHIAGLPAAPTLSFLSN